MTSLSKTDTRVVAVSDLIRSLPGNEPYLSEKTFRNPTGVVFKMENLRNVSLGKGLRNSSSIDRLVWSQLGSRPQRVRSIAEAIQLAARSLASGVPDDELAVEEEFIEGRLVTILHQRTERSRKVRLAVINHRLSRGPLSCEACSILGPVASDYFDSYFEVHHISPLSVGGVRASRPVDFALLCANCHRLIHRAISRTGRVLDISEFKQLVEKLAK